MFETRKHKIFFWLNYLHAIIDRFVVRISSSFWLAGWLNQKNCVGWHFFEFFLKIKIFELKWISPVILKRLWITENRTFEAVVRTRRTFSIIIFGGRHRPDSELGISWPYPILLDGHHPADYPMWPNWAKKPVNICTIISLDVPVHCAFGQKALIF